MRERTRKLLGARDSDQRRPALGVEQSDRGRVAQHPREKFAIVSHSAAHNRSTCATALSARSEEHTSELQSLMRISYAVFCLKKKLQTHNTAIKNTAIIEREANSEP